MSLLLGLGGGTVFLTGVVVVQSTMRDSAFPASTNLSGKSMSMAAIEPPIRANTSLSSKAVSAAFAEGSINAVYKGKITVMSMAGGQMSVLRVVFPDRLPLFQPFQNVYWPGASTSVTTATAAVFLEAEDGTAILTEDGGPLEIE